MSDPAEIKVVVGEWLEKADGDLAAAETLLQASMPTWLPGFHAQQCVEKCLKALLVSLNISFPKSHDIRSIAGLLPADLGLSIDRRLAAELTESAVTARYPGEEAPSVEVAQELVREARRVRDWVRARVAQAP